MHQALGAQQVEARFIDVLVHLGRNQLADRPLRPGVAGLRTVACPPVGEAQRLGLTPEVDHPVTGHRQRRSVERPLALVPDANQVADGARTLAGHTAPQGDAFVHERGHRSTPAAADLAEDMVVRDADVVEEDLVELGLACDLVERPDLDPLGLHVQQEVGHALVLGLLRVGSGDQHPPPGNMGQRGPDLLAVDDPLVAIAHGPGGKPGHIGTGTGLAEQLAPDLLTRVHGAQEALLLLVACVGEHHRGAHADADRVDVEVVVEDTGIPQLLVDDRLEPSALEAEAAEANRELDQRQTPVELLAAERELIDRVGRDVRHELAGEVPDFGFGYVGHRHGS